MKDEIKEILDRVKKHYVLDEIQDNLLLNYITNLQKENESLNSYYEYYKDLADKQNKLMRDYKSKCEKLELENKVLKEQMVAMVQPNYVYGIELQGVGKDER